MSMIAVELEVSVLTASGYPSGNNFAFLSGPWQLTSHYLDDVFARSIGQPRFLAELARLPLN